MGDKTQRTVVLSLGIVQLLIAAGTIWLGHFALTLRQDVVELHDSMQLLDHRMAQTHDPIRRVLSRQGAQARELDDRVAQMEQRHNRTVHVERMVPLLMWLNEHSDYDWRPEYGLPGVEVLDRKELAGRLFINPGDATPERVASVSTRLDGIYRFMDGMIYLRDGLDLESVYGQSALLHELVHFLQYASGKNERVDCRAQLERDAYDLQNLFLAQHGEPQVSDSFTVAMRSACWGRTWGY